MLTTINLQNIDGQQAKDLFQFFSTQAELGIKVWHNDNVYKINKEQFHFKHTIVQRERKEGKLGVRYELISNQKPIGQGTFGKVYIVEETIALEIDELNEPLFRATKQNINHYQRVVKIIEHTEECPTEDAEKEYTHARLATHLSFKKPTFFTAKNNKTTSFMVMKNLPGRELTQIINDDRTKKNKLTFDERIELSIALLKTSKEQVFNHHLVHRDIKPENILVSLGLNITVNIIDYGLSMEITKPNQLICGTRYYVAPEVFESGEASYKSDVFSMGRVLALIWGVDLFSYYKNAERPIHLDYSPDQLLKNLFKGTGNLSSRKKQLIRSILLGMLEKKPASRYSIDESIYSFNVVSMLNTDSERSRAALISPFFKVKLNNSNEQLAQNSCFFTNEIEEIKRRIAELVQQINSALPYPNKDKKAYQLAGLNALLDYSKEKEATLETVILKFKENFNYEKVLANKTFLLIERYHNLSEKNTLVIHIT